MKEAKSNKAWNTVWWNKNSGKGRLIGKINKIQNNYGMAIQQNLGQLGQD